MSDVTITPDALVYFTALADEAREHIAGLPESSQPFWFRSQGRSA